MDPPSTQETRRSAGAPQEQDPPLDEGRQAVVAAVVAARRGERQAGDPGPPQTINPLGTRQHPGPLDEGRQAIVAAVVKARRGERPSAVSPAPESPGADSSDEDRHRRFAATRVAEIWQQQARRDPAARGARPAPPPDDAVEARGARRAPPADDRVEAPVFVPIHRLPDTGSSGPKNGHRGDDPGAGESRAAESRAPRPERRRGRRAATPPEERPVEGRGFSLSAAFLGWLVTVGLGAVLATLFAAGASLLGVPAGADPRAAGLPAPAAAAVLMATVLLSYFVGGYVSGRMSRSHGARQGFAVWAVAVAVGLSLAVLSTFVGARLAVLDPFRLPRIAVDPEAPRPMEMAGLLLVVVGSLVSAILGGRFGVARAEAARTSARSPAPVPALRSPADGAAGPGAR